MDISVLIPVYGVEQYIEKCLRSVFEQTKTDGVEYILVNDCTKDNSMIIAQRVIDEYQHLNVRIINHECNQGLAAARQTALDAACGDYVLNVDSDDWIEPRTLEEVYEYAIRTSAEIVLFGFSIRDANEKIVTQVYPPACSSIDDYIKCMLASGKTCLVGLAFKLIKRSLFLENNIQFIKGIDNGEDRLMSITLYLVAQRAEHIPKLFYNYRMNEQSITSRPTRDQILQSAVYTTLEIEKMLNNSGKMHLFESDFMNRKCLMLQFLLQNLGSEDQKRYARIYSEVVPLIIKDKKIHLLRRMTIVLATRGCVTPYNCLTYLGGLKHKILSFIH